MGVMASQTTSLTIVYSTVYSSADQKKHQSSASLAFVRRIHRWPMNSLHKWPVTRKVFPFDDVIMIFGIFASTSLFQMNVARPHSCFPKLIYSTPYYYLEICTLLCLRSGRFYLHLFKTHKPLDTHGCVLQHQATNTHSAKYMFTVLFQFHTNHIHTE